MLVQCPKCRTTYKVADDVMKGSAPAFRCSRCKHTFELEGETPAAQPQVSPVSSEPERELTFSFNEPPSHRTFVGENTAAPAEQPSAQEVIPAGTALDDEVPTAVEAKKESRPPQEIVQSPAPLQSEQRSEQKKNAAVAAPEFADDLNNQEPENPVNVLAMASYVDQRASIFPYLTLFSLLAIAFGFIAVMSQAHPQLSASIVRNIPLLGPVLLKNNHLKEGILIRSLRSGYQSIQGNREVFFVTGVALNQNPVIIREVQITGKVFNEEGRELEQQTIWLGNTLSPKIIRGMTTEDIPHLQNLKPLKSFEIPPGDSVPFTIVFLRSAKAAKNFTCQVVTASAEV